jgi:hypothetical protein
MQHTLCQRLVLLLRERKLDILNSIPAERDPFMLVQLTSLC